MKNVKSVCFQRVEKILHRFNFILLEEFCFYYIYDFDKNSIWTAVSVFKHKKLHPFIDSSQKLLMITNREVIIILQIKRGSDAFEQPDRGLLFHY